MAKLLVINFSVSGFAEFVQTVLRFDVSRFAELMCRLQRVLVFANSPRSVKNRFSTSNYMI